MLPTSAMEKFWDYLEDEDRLVRGSSLVMALVAIGAAAIAMDGFVEKLSTSKYRFLIYLLLELFWLAYWYHERYKLPVTKKGKIGIVLSLRTESNKTKIRLKEDFVRRLNELILSNQLGNIIDIVLLKNHQAERLEPLFDKVAGEAAIANTNRLDPAIIKEWNDLRKKIRGHFFVWGAIKERDEGTYYVETNGLVTHSPIPGQLRKAFSEDATSIWGHQFSFAKKAEYRGFLFSAEYLFIEAKYIIGIAAFISGDLQTAFRLHESLPNDLQQIRFNPNYERIRKRLTHLLAEEHALFARYESDSAKAAQHLDKAFQWDPHNYTAHLLRAINEFANERNPTKALGTINAIASFAGRDGTWRYSKGFLLMYLERFEKALSVYREITRHSYEGEDEILRQVYDFNVARLKIEPEKTQSLFILGFLKYKKDRNRKEALRYFEEFLAKAQKQASFEYLVKEAQRYKQELEQEGVNRSNGATD